MNPRNGTGVRDTGVVALLVCVSALLLLWWTRRPEPVYLLAAVLATGAAMAARVRLAPPPAARRWLGWAAGLVWLALAAAGLGTHRFRQIETDWTALTTERREALGGRVARQMTGIVAQGRRAAELAARAAESEEPPFDALEEIRERSGVDALAILTPAGDLWAWAGRHRGPLPAAVRGGDGTAAFEERPLFSYLYLSRSAEGSGRRAVAAMLVETGLIGPEAAMEGTYAARSRVPATFRAGGDPAAVWSLVESGDTIVSARIEPATQAELRDDAEIASARVILACTLLALLLLATAWLRVLEGQAAPWQRALPLVALAIALTVARLGGVLGLEPVFTPLMFALPLPGDPSLGDLLGVLIPLAALAAASRAPVMATRSPLPFALAGALAVAIAFPAAIRIVVRASAPDVLESSRWLWFGLQPAATLLIAVVALLGMPRVQPLVPPLARRSRILLVVGGLAASAVMGAVLVARLDPHPLPPILTTLPWVVAFVPVAIGLAWARGRRGGLARFTAAVWLAATAVAPNLWSVNTWARLRAAERELATLGTQAPPIIDYLLLEFGREVRARAAAGETGLQLLHRSWVASGLAREPWAARITLWQDGERTLELDLGQGEPAPYELSVLRNVVEQAIMDSVPRVSDVSSTPLMAKYVTAPLPDGSIVTVTVPPRRSLAREGVIGVFLGDPGGPDARLTLVEATGETPAGVHWNRTDDGWRSETIVLFPEGDYHAHLEVVTTPLAVLLARGVLLLAFDLGLAVLIWSLGCFGRGRSPVPAGGLRQWTGSFRARVTFALFGFFLLPTALFGYVAYRALAGEVERAARIIASRAVAQAVVEWPDAGGDLRVLSERVGGEVLHYYRGELVDASSPEGVDLGVYGAWMPPDLYRRLESPEEVSSIERQSVAGQSFLMAYHALPPAPVALAVPTPLTSGEAADRQRELAHLILFAALMGALLSLALSVQVGRALAGPIGRLRRAASAVGAGRLSVQLPETTGEFGELFASFNRMTRRLRRARAREVRMARVLAWGEMARQIAHEIKNPLTPIKLSVQHLRRAWRDRSDQYDEILEENVQQILREIDRLTEIARAFSRYGAPQRTDGPLEPVDVAAVVREALTLYRAGDAAVQYVADVEPKLPPARARGGELKEVLFNLIENARAAIDGPGTITVQAQRNGSALLLSVVDDGPGIPQELLDRVFEPHFSTRSAGTGLGLAIVRRLVESWGGSVTAESGPGQGTAVRIRLMAATTS